MVSLYLSLTLKIKDYEYCGGRNGLCWTCNWYLFCRNGKQSHLCGHQRGDEQAIMITEILDRDNYVARQSPHNKRQQHIIASNLDQSILLATLKSPKTSQGFIDRFLIACESFHIPAIIVFNKADLYQEKEMALFEEMKLMYEAVGYKVLLISVEKQKGLDQLADLLQNKTTLIS